MYEAGHEVPAYAAEAAYKVFMRVLFNQDVATGEIDTLTNPDYATEGPDNTWQFRTLGPQQPAQFCYVLDPSTCTDEQIEVLENGTGMIKNYILIDANSTKLFPELLDDDEEQAGNGTSGSPGAYTGAASVLEGHSSIITALVIGLVALFVDTF
jgi:hypothetical protein